MCATLISQEGKQLIKQLFSCVIINMLFSFYYGSI